MPSKRPSKTKSTRGKRGGESLVELFPEAQAEGEILRLVGASDPGKDATPSHGTPAEKRRPAAPTDDAHVAQPVMIDPGALMTGDDDEQTSG